MEDRKKTSEQMQPNRKLKTFWKTLDKPNSCLWFPKGTMKGKTLICREGLEQQAEALAENSHTCFIREAEYENLHKILFCKKNNNNNLGVVLFYSFHP